MSVHIHTQYHLKLCLFSLRKGFNYQLTSRIEQRGWTHLFYLGARIGKATAEKRKWSFDHLTGYCPFGCPGLTNKSHCKPGDCCLPEFTLSPNTRLTQLSICIYVSAHTHALYECTPMRWCWHIWITPGQAQPHGSFGSQSQSWIQKGHISTDLTNESGSGRGGEYKDHIQIHWPIQDLPSCRASDRAGQLLSSLQRRTGDIQMLAHPKDPGSH